MEQWPGYEGQDTTPTTDNSKDKGRQKPHHRESSYWRWPHVEHGSIGRATLVSKGGRLQWSTVVDTSRSRTWLPLGRPAKVFPETRSPQVNVREHRARQRSEKGLQYLRTYYPDADFPSELLGSTLDAEARDVRRLEAFDPFLGNLLQILPSHHTQNESIVAFPMGELGRELNISPFRSAKSANTLFDPSAFPSFAFETPILQISSAILPSQWIATPSSALLIRTHTSSSLLRLQRSKVTRELDITRSETGDIPIVDSKILAAGPDIVVVNRGGTVYKCNTPHGGKAMQLIRGHEISNDDDHFWQLGITGRNDECFLTSYKAVKHLDFRSASSATEVFSLNHPSAIVTSFESPMHDHISRVTTTSDVIWLDDRFRKRPLMSFKHYRSFDRTLRVLTANVSGASFSLLMSRRNGLVTLYDVKRGSSGLLHCNSVPACLPHDGPMFTTYDGHALVVLPSDVELSLLRLSQRGNIQRQDIRVVRPDQDELEIAQEDRATHRWNEDVQILEKLANELQTDFGPAGARHYTEVDLRGAYEKVFPVPDSPQGEEKDENAFYDMLARLPNFWQDSGKTVKNMLTMFDIVSRVEGGDTHTSHADFLIGSNINSKQGFDALMRGDLPVQNLTGPAAWHYSIHNTSIPALTYHSDDWTALHECLKELNLVSEVERHDAVVRRETEAREQLVLDLALANNVYSAQPFAEVRSSTAGDATSNTIAHTAETSYSEDPPEVKFGYFQPVRKVGTEHYTDKDPEGEQAPGVSSPLGVRLLLAEWEVGTDPEDYMYRDPYGLAEIDTQPIPQYRSLPAGLPEQKKQIAPTRPPLVVATSTRPPQFEPGLDAELMTSTQVLPGPFGGRPGDVGKKLAKKRIGGF